MSARTSRRPTPPPSAAQLALFSATIFLRADAQGLACDSGDLSSTCVISTARTLSQASSSAAGLTIAGSGSLSCAAAGGCAVALSGSLQVLGSLAIGSGAGLWIRAASASIAAGASISSSVSLLPISLVAVAGDVTIGGTLSGGNVTVIASGAIAVSGIVSANGLGYCRGQGSGGGGAVVFTGGLCDLCGCAAGGGGGGYGGAGGSGFSNCCQPGYVPGAGGGTYGSNTAPTNFGSGGGDAFAAYWAGRNGYCGGGIVRLIAGSQVSVSGSISANGHAVTENSNVCGWADTSGGAGSGGSVWLTAPSYSCASSGVISADGGSLMARNKAAGGGGGRVAITGSTSFLSGCSRISALGGVPVSFGLSNPDPTEGASGMAGTVFQANVTISTPTASSSMTATATASASPSSTVSSSATRSPSVSASPRPNSCLAVQGFVTLEASDAANLFGYSVVVAPQSTCSMLSRSSGSLRCAPATLTTTYQGVPVYFVGRSEDIPLALMGSAPDSCGVSPTPSASPSLTATPSPTPTRSYSPSPSPSYVAPYFRPLPPGAGNGLGGQVDCVCNFGSLVVFGGAFTALGNGTAASRIAAWDGSAWRTLGQGLASGAHPSQCLTANNQLYVGTSGEGGSAGALWTWSGSAWSTVGSSGFSSNCYLGGLVQWGSKIVAACNFELKAWDGSSWSTVTTVNNNIYALIVYENYVFLGGSFTNPSNNVAKCDSSLTCTGNAGPFVANPTYNYVLAFGIHNGALYAAGYLQVGQNLYVLSSATGTWTQSTPTAGGDVHFLCSFRGLLYVGAWNSNEVYVQDTATNSIVPVGGAGLSGGSFANAAAVNNNMLYIGGQFSSIASSGVSANNAVAWG